MWGPKSLADMANGGPVDMWFDCEESVGALALETVSGNRKGLRYNGLG